MNYARTMFSPTMFSRRRSQRARLLFFLHTHTCTHSDGATVQRRSSGSARPIRKCYVLVLRQTWTGAEVIDKAWCGVACRGRGGRRQDTGRKNALGSRARGEEKKRAVESLTLTGWGGGPALVVAGLARTGTGLGPGSPPRS